MFRGSSVSAALVLFGLAGTAMAQLGQTTGGNLGEQAPLGLHRLTSPNFGRLNPAVDVDQSAYETASPTHALTNRAGRSSSDADIGNFRAFVAPPLSAPFPFADTVLKTYVNPLPVTGCAVAHIMERFSVVSQPNPRTNFDDTYTFYRTVDLSNTTSSTIPWYSDVIGSIRVGPFGQNPGFIEWFENASDILLSTAINFDREQFGYVYRSVNTGTSTTMKSVSGLVEGNTATPVGSSAFTAWADRLPLGTGGISTRENCGDGLISNIINERFLGGVAGVTTTERDDTYLRLQAKFPATLPPAVVANLGTLDCAAAAGSGGENSPVMLSEQFPALNPSDPNAHTVTQWYKFTIGGVTGAAESQSTYLDINTDHFAYNDPTPPSTVLALYNDLGQSVVYGQLNSVASANGGLAEDAQLSWGHGRRPSPLSTFGNSGTGEQRDGRFGDLAPGTYYLAVAGNGAAFGGSSFSVDDLDAFEEGHFDIMVRHNLGTGGSSLNCAMPAPVAPNTINLDDAGSGFLVSGVTSTIHLDGFGQVTWYDFHTDFDINAANPGNFLDIDNEGSVNGVTETMMAMYNDAGVAVSGTWADPASYQAFRNVSTNGSDALAQLSFRQPGTSRPAVSNGAPYAGQNGSAIPAGHYYLVAGLQSFNNAAGTEGADVDTTGWQARSNSGSFLNVNVNIRTPSNCRPDYDLSGVRDPDDLSSFITDFFTVPHLSGLDYTGYADAAEIAAAQAAGAPEPYFTNGYTDDYDGSGAVDPDDLSSYITDYFIGC